MNSVRQGLKKNPKPTYFSNEIQQTTRWMERSGEKNQQGTNYQVIMEQILSAQEGKKIYMSFENTGDIFKLAQT